MLRFVTTLGLLCCLANGAAWGASGRSLGDATRLDADDTLGAYAVAVARSDSAGAAAALVDAQLSDSERSWLAARLMNGDPARALASFRRAQLEEVGELALVAAFVDRDAMFAAVRAADAEVLAEILDDPIADHSDDALWEAGRAALALLRDDADTATKAFERAWNAASARERRQEIFAHAAIAWIRHGDAERAATTWLDFAEGLRWSSERRHATAFFNDHPSLLASLDHDGLRVRAIAWLARVVLRDAALGIARGGLTSIDPQEIADCYVLGAEQFYRLRRHDELGAWLDNPRPDGLNAEQLAALDAYPWGVRRRSGSSVEVARGFDSVVAAHAGTRRAEEALWESAWMWELSAEEKTALERFQHYARSYPSGSYAKAAATRVVFLAFQMGDMEGARRYYDEFDPILGDSYDRASAVWTAALASRSLGEDSAAAAFDSLLAHDHTRGPFWSPPATPLQDAAPFDSTAIDVALTQIVATQQAALATVREHLGVSDSSLPDLAIARELYRYGAFPQADAELADFAAQRRRDPVAQCEAVALCLQAGRYERQARAAFQLRLLLAGHNVELDAALDVLAHPTPFARDVLYAASEMLLEPELLWAIMRRESFYDPQVLSLAGAYGLLQLLPKTAVRMAARLELTPPEPDQLREPLLNLRLGARYVAQLMDEAGGDIYRALAAYNAGEANGERWAARRSSSLPPEEILLLISYTETRGYVYHVLRFWKSYAEIYPTLRGSVAAEK